MEVFLSMNRKNGKLECPICGKKVYDLKYDMLIDELIKKASDNTKTILIDNNFIATDDNGEFLQDLTKMKGIDPSLV